MRVETGREQSSRSLERLKRNFDGSAPAMTPCRWPGEGEFLVDADRETGEQMQSRSREKTCARTDSPKPAHSDSSDPDERFTTGVVGVEVGISPGSE